MSRVARGLSLVAGGAVSGQVRPADPCLPGVLGGAPTLAELFAVHPRDGGWAGFLLAQITTDKPLLWVQDRMAILESGD